MNTLSLFSGCGALDLGLQRAGATIVGQVEIDEFCRSILNRHFTEVPKHDDVLTAVDWWWNKPRPRVDIVAGGPPCQPFSHAGDQLGIADPRWMWPAMERVVRALRPRFVIMENVVGILRDTDAFGKILGDLASLGFDAEWSVLPACALGAPHTRERLFLVAYADVLDGALWLGDGDRGPIQPGDRFEGTWRDRVDWALEASRADGRDADGFARKLVEAGGNAVAVPVAEYVGRLVMEAS